MKTRIHLDDPLRNQSESGRGALAGQRRRTNGLIDKRYVKGPYSRAIDRGGLGWAISGCSREGRFIKAYEAMLTEHVGGHPSIIQRAMISRAARLALHLELMDQCVLADGKTLTAHDYAHYVAWSNGLTRTLARLGIEPAGAPVQPSALDQYLGMLSARRGAAD
jgi:hypothetical protein